MRSFISTISPLLVVAGVGLGCGGGGTDAILLTTLEVTSADTTLFTLAPGNTVTLSVVAKDQNGNTMFGVASPSFSSDNGAVAGASGDGTITAVAAGSARVTASLTVGGVTKTGSLAMTVVVAPATARVVAPAAMFEPAIVDVSAGGTVTWAFDSVPHQVTFTTPGAPADIPSFQNGSAFRTFPNPGTYHYQCSGPQMSGEVRVH